jgi:2,3-bisphosphoglycerate-independent phosphoglycerate mutase
MSLLGFDPLTHHTGRGPIEAAAMGLELGEDDLVFRLNLVNVENFGPDGTMRDYSAGHIDGEKAAEIVNKLQAELGGGQFEFFPGVSYRHILVQRGGAKAPEAKLAVNPPHDITDKPIGEDFEAYSGSELFPLMQAAHEMLAADNLGTKATCIWPWGQGRPLKLPSFKSAFGLNGAVISAVDLVRGLGRACGMEVLHVHGATGLLDTNYEGKVEAAVNFLQGGGDFAYLHVEAPDECGHSGICADKVEAIERFDRRVVGPIVETLGSGAAILVACDHFTPLAVRTHTPEPVPFMLAAPSCHDELPGGYTEATCAKTGLSIDPGFKLMAWTIGKARS